jgi:hypothetical protein
MVNNSSRLRQYERRFLKGEITCREKEKEALWGHRIRESEGGG